MRSRYLGLAPCSATTIKIRMAQDSAERPAITAARVPWGQTSFSTCRRSPSGPPGHLRLERGLVPTLFPGFADAVGSDSDPS